MSGKVREFDHDWRVTTLTYCYSCCCSSDTLQKNFARLHCFCPGCFSDVTSHSVYWVF